MFEVNREGITVLGVIVSGAVGLAALLGVFHSNPQSVCEMAQAYHRYAYGNAPGSFGQLKARDFRLSADWQREPFHYDAIIEAPGARTGTHKFLSIETNRFGAVTNVLGMSERPTAEELDRRYPHKLGEDCEPSS